MTFRTTNGSCTIPRKKKPGYWNHKPSGQAYVRIDGKDHYLGAYDCPESRDRYEELIRGCLSLDAVEGIGPFVGCRAWAMIQLQLLAGLRPAAASFLSVYASITVRVVAE